MLVSHIVCVCILYSLCVSSLLSVLTSIKSAVCCFSATVGSSSSDMSSTHRLGNSTLLFALYYISTGSGPCIVVYMFIGFTGICMWPTLNKWLSFSTGTLFIGVYTEMQIKMVSVVAWYSFKRCVYLCVHPLMQLVRICIYAYAHGMHTDTHTHSSTGGVIDPVV